MMKEGSPCLTARTPKESSREFSLAMCSGSFRVLRNADEKTHDRTFAFEPRKLGNLAVFYASRNPTDASREPIDRPSALARSLNPSNSLNFLLLLPPFLFPSVLSSAAGSTIKFPLRGRLTCDFFPFLFSPEECSSSFPLKRRPMCSG